jgi:gamma-glutamylcyclotransferase (GGCT)/AIG2-like uncharacterized protein YtfP
MVLRRTWYGYFSPCFINTLNAHQSVTEAFISARKWMVNVFTYGSLMYADIVNRIVRNRYTCAEAEIGGFKRSQIQGDVYPVVRPCRHAKNLRGVLYFNINRADLLRLDRFEGLQYQRQKVKATLLATNQRISSQLYVLKPRYRHLASQREWKPSQFQNQHKNHFTRRYLAAIKPRFNKPVHVTPMA